MILAEILNNDATPAETIADLATQAGLTVLNVKKTTINNLYTEYMVDVTLPDGVINDRQMSSTSAAKAFRTAVKQQYGANNLRGQSVVGLVAANGNGRFVMQIKNM